MPNSGTVKDPLATDGWAMANRKISVQHFHRGDVIHEVLYHPDVVVSLDRNGVATGAVEYAGRVRQINIDDANSGVGQDTGVQTYLSGHPLPLLLSLEGRTGK